MEPFVGVCSRCKENVTFVPDVDEYGMVIGQLSECCGAYPLEEREEDDYFAWDRDFGLDTLDDDDELFI